MAPVSRKREDQATGPGKPWLTLLLALGCALGFGSQLVAERSSERALHVQLEAAAEYLLERPYLRAPKLLEEHIGAQRLETARHDYELGVRRRAGVEVPAGVVRRNQEELKQRMAHAQTLVSDVPAQRFGLSSDGSPPEALVGHVFVHLGWLHLLPALGLLALLGVALEASLGSLLVGCIAILSAVGAGVAFVQFSSGGLPYVGLTGVLAGLWGAFLVRLAGVRSESHPGLAFVAGGIVLLLPALIGLELAVAGPEGLEPPNPGVWNASTWALLGGFGAGLLAALALRVLGVEGALSPATQGQKRNRPLERALAHFQKGRSQQAYQELVDILRREPDDVEAALALWKVALPLGRTEAAAPALLRAIRCEVERGELDSAATHWLDLVDCDLDGLADPGQLLRMASLLRDAGEDRAALRALRSALDRAAGAAVASRIAREASLLDPRTAEEAAWRALGSLDLDLAERQSLETLLGELQPKLAAWMKRDEPQPGPRPEPRRQPDASAAAVSEAPPREIEFEAKARPLEATVAVPVGLDSAGIVLAVEGRKKRLPFDRVKAVAVASVDGLSDRPVIVVDLVLNWMSLTAEPLRLIRLRSDGFDPRSLVSGKSDPLDALRSLSRTLLHHSDAAPLPDLQSVSGMPFAAFPSLADYQRDVLLVETTED